MQTLNGDTVRRSLLAGQVASGLSLEGDDDHGQFDVSLLLQLGQDARPEEHLALADAVQVGVQVQVLHLEPEKRCLRSSVPAF